MRSDNLESKLDEILTELSALKEMVRQRQTVVPRREPKHPDDLVDAHYVARRFGCSVRSVQAGLCNTGLIARVTSKPLRFRKGDVDDVLAQLLLKVKAPKQKFPRLVRRKPRSR